MVIQSERGRQKGFGLLEVVVAVVVFLVVVGLGVKGFKIVSGQYGEAKAIRDLSDVLMSTSERMSAHTIDHLKDGGSGYLEWSSLEKVGKDRYFRYRINPAPAVNGEPDTAVVGLEMVYGKIQNGDFVEEGRHSTLIAPSVADMNTGDDSTVQTAMQASQALFEAHREGVDAAKAEAMINNPLFLNPYQCYEPGDCCGYLSDWATDGFPPSRADDGEAEKCDYRCLQSGALDIEEWEAECNLDLCALVPWDNASDCRNRFPENSFEDVLCSNCFSNPCEGCCDDLEGLLRTGASHMPAGYPLSEDCNVECVEEWGETGNGRRIDFDFWSGTCGGEEKLCSTWGVQDATDCCRLANDGRGAFANTLCGECKIWNNDNPVTWQAGCREDVDECNTALREHYDCATMTECDGDPIKYGWIPGMGNVREKCAELAASGTTCNSLCGVPISKEECCNNRRLHQNGAYETDRFKEQCLKYKGTCCNVPLYSNGNPLQCGTGGNAIAVKISGDWMCPQSSSTHDVCKNVQGCSSVYKWPGAPSYLSCSGSGSGSSGSSDDSKSTESKWDKIGGGGEKKTIKKKTIKSGSGSGVTHGGGNE